MEPSRLPPFRGESCSHVASNSHAISLSIRPTVQKAATAWGRMTLTPRRKQLASSPPAGASGAIPCASAGCEHDWWPYGSVRRSTCARIHCNSSGGKLCMGKRGKLSVKSVHKKTMKKKGMIENNGSGDNHCCGSFICPLTALRLPTHCHGSTR